MQKKMLDIVNKLSELYKSPKCELNFNSNYELLVVVILSAQCTDKRVNQIAPLLFEKAKTPYEMVKLGEQNVAEIIKPCGFFNNKAKNIIKASKDIIDRFNGEVPSDEKDLVSLAGVGRKTASVVQSIAFKIPAIAVDTHVFRLSHRLGITSKKTPDKVQDDLQVKIDKKYWIDFHYSLVLHGRYICKARKPECTQCGLKDYCKFVKEKNKIRK